MKFLLDLPTNIFRDTEAELQIGLGLSNMVRASLGITLIKLGAYFGPDTSLAADKLSRNKISLFLLFTLCRHRHNYFVSFVYSV